jgi:hypothetical protein
MLRQGGDIRSPGSNQNRAIIILHCRDPLGLIKIDQVCEFFLAASLEIDVSDNARSVFLRNGSSGIFLSQWNAQHKYEG